MKTTVICKLQVEGLHYWPDAAKIIPEMAFLADSHRHVFFIECEAVVYHDDRDIEFIQFKRKVLDYLYQKYGNSVSGYSKYTYCDFGAMSCEMIAEDLLDKFNLYTCSVFEDNENGSKIYSRESLSTQTKGNNYTA